jgi:hypothetical protein
MHKRTVGRRVRCLGGIVLIKHFFASNQAKFGQGALFENIVILCGLCLRVIAVAQGSLLSVVIAQQTRRLLASGSDSYRNTSAPEGLALHQIGIWNCSRCGVRTQLAAFFRNARSLGCKMVTWRVSWCSASIR